MPVYLPTLDRISPSKYFSGGFQCVVSFKLNAYGFFLIELPLVLYCPQENNFKECWFFAGGISVNCISLIRSSISHLRSLSLSVVVRCECAGF